METWDDEKYDLPSGAGEEPEEGETDEELGWEDMFSDDSPKSNNETNKAARAEALSGTPGFVPIPEAYDGVNKPVKTKKLEDKSLKEMMDWLEELQQKAKVEVDRLYNGDFLKGGPGSGIKGHTTAKKETVDRLRKTEPDEPAIKIKEILDNLKELTTLPTPKKPLPGMVGTSKYTQGVYFDENIPVRNLKSIETGLNKVFKKHDIGVVQLGTTSFYDDADSVYISDKKGDDVLSDYIGINTDFAKNPEKVIEQDKKLVQNKKQKRMKTIEENIKTISEDLKNTKSQKTTEELKYMLKENENDLEGLKNAVRWTTTQDAKDPLENVMIHEAYHAVFAHKKLQGKWNDNIKNIDKNERFKVSEYAASDNEELFAETGAAIEAKITIPESIKRAFEETLRGVK